MRLEATGENPDPRHGSVPALLRSDFAPEPEAGKAGKQLITVLGILGTGSVCSQ
jgi:hypothetical protein